MVLQCILDQFTSSHKGFFPHKKKQGSQSITANQFKESKHIWKTWCLDKQLTAPDFSASTLQQAKKIQLGREINVLDSFTTKSCRRWWIIYLDNSYTNSAHSDPDSRLTRYKHKAEKKNKFNHELKFFFPIFLQTKPTQKPQSQMDGPKN